jgi:cholesterol transport system auxiliary component
MLKYIINLSYRRVNNAVRSAVVLTAVCALAACATPQAPATKTVYDLGLPVARASAPSASSSSAAPGNATMPAATSTTAATAKSLAVLMLSDVISPTALDSTAVVYRLAYADAQQLRAYNLARWSMPPAQLVQLRLRDALGARGPVIGVADGVAPWRLQVELDEFSHVFESPGRSAGVVSLRATLLHKEQWAGQQVFSATANASAQDAAGGVRALTAATDDAVTQMDGWVAQQMQLPK